MFVRILFDGSKSVVELAKFCGIAPCQILATNKCTEDELINRVMSGATRVPREAGTLIDLQVSTPTMIRQLAWFYMVGQDGRLVKYVAE